MTPTRSVISTAVVSALMALVLISAPAAAQDEAAALRDRIRAATTPGARHEALEYFIGEWDVELVLSLPGGEEQRASGQATYEWLIPGRWVAQRLTDDLMGGRNESFAIIGYDNYAKSYVIAGVSSFDTALNTSRGPVAEPEGGTIVTYGRQDDYTTGELHKPYKIVTRILDEDHHVVETWDLGTGPEGTRVFEYTYTRRPE